MTTITAVTQIYAMAVTDISPVAQMPGVTTMAVERATDCRDQQEQAREGGAAGEDKKQVIIGKRLCHADHLQAGSIDPVPTLATRSPGGLEPSRAICFSLALQAVRLYGRF